MIVLSLARNADAVAIARMSRDLVEHGLDWAWTPPRVAASVRGRDALVVVARDDHDRADRIAGFAIMRFGDDDAHLDLLGVRPDCRRRGLGRALVAWAEAPAVLAGITDVFLEVRESNRDGRAFYERLGYRTLGRVGGYYQGREAAVRMGRELGAPYDDFRHFVVDTCG
ncbi:MAG: GNAT family N-acetyltransferase [Deltaproteobacteria bacterium]|nr:GNAT family N-acetyltransferase [Deltaproteobacteria bacterium]